MFIPVKPGVKSNYLLVKPVCFMNHIHVDQIRTLRPAAQTIVPLDSGEMNDMILVDDTEVFRFPRNDESRQRLHYEARVLKRLDGSLVTPIPKLVYFDEKVPFSVLSYIAGEIYDEEQVRHLPHEQKASFAVMLATFMRELNEHLDVAELDNWTKQLMSEPETWDAYYERISQLDSDNKYLEKYKTQYEKVKSLRSTVANVPTIAIHGDLHAGNMLIQDGALAGLIDFGDCETGTIYNELRPLCSLGADIVEMVVAELGDSLGKVSLELVREFAVMHELSVLARSTPEQLANSSRVQIARNMLHTWLGDNWDSQQAPQIRAIIFDCFGVLTSEGWIPFRRRHFKGDAAKAFAQSMMQRLVTGRIQTKEFVSTIAEKGELEEHEVRASLSGSMPDTELFAWITKHKPQYKIGMLSNAGSNMLHTLFTPEQRELFDDVVLSYQVGVAKPNPEIYILAAKRLGVRPEQCLFVDDKETFCDAARSVGMRAVKYVDIEHFISDIARQQT